jgi:2-iminobutanoate/2-iminopropanoate deaminase
MNNRSIVNTLAAPKAIGPYSQAVSCGAFVFTSGQLPLRPDANEIVGVDIKEQCRQVIENLRAILESCGSDLGSVLKTTVFIRDLKDFPAVNEVYAEYFKGDYPARSTVEVSGLPKDARIEIEAIAAIRA